jgi:hypothetical protein
MQRLAWIILLVLATAAAAQEGAPPPKPSDEPAVVERQVRGRAGRTIRLVVITNVRPDCTSGPLPTVRLESAPKHGRVTVQRGRYTATNVRQCLATEVPALIAVYRSAEDFEGSDTVTLELRFEGRPPQLRRYTLLVTKVDDGSRI